MNDNLPDLRDIHLPDGVSAFPPAPGWYVLLLACVGLWLLYRWLLVLRQRSRRLYALRILSSLDKSNVVVSAVKISEILRRICIYRYPEAVSLSGREWLNFLHAHSKNTLPDSAAELLLNAPYAKPDGNYERPETLSKLIEFAKHWIGENL